LTSETGRLIFRSLKYIIVDEIHAISNNKRGVHLSLSLERLMALLDHEPTRIGLSATQKPLERVAAFLGGQCYNPKTEKHEPRPVAIVDAGQRKNIDLQVISPVQDWSDLPDASVWPLVIDKTYELITSHQNTLVFVNMRAQSEKVARQLNEKHREITGDPDAELALAHHGSISREMRYETEARLKAGDIPAVIATASLELGIDIGSIDLVVQLQSPGDVSSGLQRIGRSGHVLDSTSKGRIIPLFQADVDDCLAITQAIFDRDIEETAIPENALDVLSQQIVAEVAMRDWPRLELYHVFRNSYCYRYMSETAFNNVVDMLSGRFGDTELRALQPRLTWDHVNDLLIARRGSRLLSVMNGGTIEDRGYYGVYLEGANTRLGEVEEEFVFESRVGDIFFLGNNEWRIAEITRDRIMVSPRGSTKPRAPFWKGEPMYRGFATSRKIGAFRQQLLQSENTSPQKWHADANTVGTLKDFLRRQKEHTTELPTDHTIVVEYFRDSVDEPQIVIHAPFGGRVIGAWATALGSALEKRFGLQVQFTYDDDGMLFRLLDADELPDIEKLLDLSFEHIKEFLIEAISQTPMFIVRFRHNATRALMLTRSRTDKRIPLWLQRLRGADLLQAVRDIPDFPILLETYRDCLQDLFDIDSLKIVLDEIRTGTTKIHYVHTSSPSPMTAGLMFRFLSEQMYDYDRFRTTGHAAEISSELLADILTRGDIPTIISPDVVAAAEQHWQYLSPERLAKDSEDCFEVIDKLGPISFDELLPRCAEHPQQWINELFAGNRIIALKDQWMSQATHTLLVEEDKREIVRRFLRRSGPKTTGQIADHLVVEIDNLESVLLSLHDEKDIVRGHLVFGVGEEQWCDRDNFALLYRQAISARRKAHEPGDRSTFLQFQLHWHHIAKNDVLLQGILNQYAGMNFPLGFFERELLPLRLRDNPDVQSQFQELIDSGEVMPIAIKSEGGRYNVRFNLRGREHIFRSKEDLDELAVELVEDTNTVHQFLKENGASPHRDICDGAGLSAAQVDEALTQLARLGLASCDFLPSFLAMLQNDPAPKTKMESSWQQHTRQPWMRSSRPSRRAYVPKHEIQSRLYQRKGRWLLTSSFAVMGKTIAENKRAEIQARLLLQRYGIVVKEFYRREQGLVSWYRIFQVLKKMEWSGEIRRGYFIDGLSGVQFATENALRLLEKINSNELAMKKMPHLISTIDPALPFGGQLDWELADERDHKITVTRSGSNHIYFYGAEPIVYLENFALRLFFTNKADEKKRADLPALLKNWLRFPEPLRPRKKIDITQINGRPAAKHELSSLFQDNGFEIDGDGLVLWPSHI
jgi:ATP-dependent Lhr-like helicase